jgi:hypothetical protein
MKPRAMETRHPPWVPPAMAQPMVIPRVLVCRGGRRHGGGRSLRLFEGAR